LKMAEAERSTVGRGTDFYILGLLEMKRAGRQ
jgi:hypothetical protein